MTTSVLPPIALGLLGALLFPAIGLFVCAQLVVSNSFDLIR